LDFILIKPYLETTCLMWSFFNVPLKGHIRQVWLQFKMQYYEVLIIRGINFQDFHGLFIQYMILNPKYKKSKSHITIEHVNVTLTLSSITHGWSRSDTLHSSLVGQLTHGWWMESIRVWKGYLHSPHDEHRPSGPRPVKLCSVLGPKTSKTLFCPRAQDQ
jgi:hypothetical protein